jgi:hypothetical protein
MRIAILRGGRRVVKRNVCRFVCFLLRREQNWRIDAETPEAWAGIRSRTLVLANEEWSNDRSSEPVLSEGQFTKSREKIRDLEPHIEVLSSLLIGSPSDGRPSAQKQE